MLLLLDHSGLFTQERLCDTLTNNHTAKVYSGSMRFVRCELGQQRHRTRSSCLPRSLVRAFIQPFCEPPGNGVTKWPSVTVNVIDVPKAKQIRCPFDPAWLFSTPRTWGKKTTCSPSSVANSPYRRWIESLHPEISCSPSPCAPVGQLHSKCLGTP